jgi:small GTP-binding protein
MLPFFKKYKSFKITSDVLPAIQSVQDKDPLTFDKFRIGDKIVICDNCKTIMDENTWVYNGKACALCNSDRAAKQLIIMPRDEAAINAAKLPNDLPEPTAIDKDEIIKVIVRIQPSNEDIDIDVPRSATFQMMVDEIVNASLLEKGKEYKVFNARAGNQVLLYQTLWEQNIQDGDTLIVSEEASFIPIAAEIKPTAPDPSINDVINITVSIAPSGEELDVELPHFTTTQELIEELINHDALNRLSKYSAFSKMNGRELALDKSLWEMGVRNGDTLIITPLTTSDEYVGVRDRLANVPNEVIKKGPAYIEEYLKKMEGKSVYEQSQALNECKLIFVGSGEVGKTSLIKRIVEDKFDANELKTDGIDITKWSFKKGDENVKLNIWDFGGQEIMHATHKFFMTRRAIYVLVINPRIQDQHAGDIELNYWLKLISSFAGASPIIIVINKSEVHKIDLAKGALTDSFPQIMGFVETSCKMNTGIDNLKSMIGDAIAQLHHLKDIIPLSFLKIKEELENVNKDYFHYHEYMRLCNRVDPDLSEDDMEMLIGLLNDLGVMLNISANRRLADTQVLNPEWITNGVYSIINSDRIIDNKGIIDEDEIAKFLDLKLYPTKRERGFIMDMMSHFELCFQIPDQEYCYFIPGAFPKDKPKDLHWPFDNYLHFQLKYDVLPNSIISRFLVKIHSNIYQQNYWRNGAVIQDGYNFAYVEAIPFDKKIVIRVAGDGEKRDLLSVIRREFEKIHKTISKIKVEYYIALDARGELLINYQDLLSYEEEGIETYFEPRQRKKYSVKQLLSGIEERVDLNEVKELISQGKINDALNDLRAVFPNSNEIVLLSARLNKAKQNLLSGLIDEKEYSKEENQVIAITLNTIDQFQEQYGTLQKLRKHN